MNKIEEKMGIWHNGVLKARARAFVWVIFHSGNYPWIHIDEKNNRLAKMILASEADVMK